MTKEESDKLFAERVARVEAELALNEATYRLRLVADTLNAVLNAIPGTELDELRPGARALLNCLR